MAVFLIVLYSVLITPVELGVAASVGFGGRPRYAAAVMLWGVRLQLNGSLIRDENGKLQWTSSFRGKSRQAEAGGLSPVVRQLFRALKNARRSRMLLQKTVRVTDLSLQADVGGLEADQVALLTALLQTLGAVQNRLRIETRPVFRGKGGISIRCIVRARLGTLLAAGLLGAKSYLAAGKKEAMIWNIPSGT